MAKQTDRKLYSTENATMVAAAAQSYRELMQALRQRELQHRTDYLKQQKEAEMNNEWTIIITRGSFRTGFADSPIYPFSATINTEPGLVGLGTSMQEAVDYLFESLYDSSRHAAD